MLCTSWRLNFLTHPAIFGYYDPPVVFNLIHLILFPANKAHSCSSTCSISAKDPKSWVSRSPLALQLLNFRTLSLPTVIARYAFFGSSTKDVSVCDIVTAGAEGGEGAEAKKCHLQLQCWHPSCSLSNKEGGKETGSFYVSNIFHTTTSSPCFFFKSNISLIYKSLCQYLKLWSYLKVEHSWQTMTSDQNVPKFFKSFRIFFF